MSSKALHVHKNRKSLCEALNFQASLEVTYVDDEGDLVQRISAFVTDQANKPLETAKPMMQVYSAWL